MNVALYWEHTGYWVCDVGRLILEKEKKECIQVRAELG
jgi:hypothetical protein